MSVGERFFRDRRGLPLLLRAEEDQGLLRFGEETVTHNLYDLLPIGAPVLMMGLSMLFCAIQAVVFTMLTSIYLEEAVEVE